MRVVAYYRVSTARQGQSGLGLDAQRAAVAAFVAGRGGAISAEFEEVESGRKSDRPQLAAAVALCKREKATLIIAKLDRLARNVRFITTLIESGVQFQAVDMPEAIRLTVHVIAAVAEHERGRYFGADDCRPPRGIKLGNPQPDLPKARASASRRASIFHENMRPPHSHAGGRRHVPARRRGRAEPAKYPDAERRRMARCDGWPTACQRVRTDSKILTFSRVTAIAT